MLLRSETLARGNQAPEFTLPSNRGDPNSRWRGISARTGAAGLPSRHVVSQLQDALRRTCGTDAGLRRSAGSQWWLSSPRSVCGRDATWKIPGLPFFVLIDETRAVTKQYGVWRRLGLDAWNIARPALFAIDSDRDHPGSTGRRDSGRVSRTGADR